MMRHVGIAFLIAWVGAVASFGQVGDDAGGPDGQPESTFERLQRQAAKMIHGLQQFEDWDTQYEYQIDAIERVYERNGWTSEPDLFSLELAKEVGQIPPWQMRERFDRAVNIIGDRYLLDDDQKQLLEGLVLRENQKLFSKHADAIMQYAMEAIQTRAAGEPFTPEQIARWTRLAEPVFKDSRASLKRSAGEFMQHLDPEQRELVQADLDAANHRMDTIEQMTERWKRGEWKASDWGLEDDPIQNGQELAERGAAGESAGAAARRPDRASIGSRGGAEPPVKPGVGGRPAARVGSGEVVPRPVAPGRDAAGAAAKRPDDAWARYVREFIRRYQLNDDQQQKAWLFYKDARKRADVMDKRFVRQSGEAKRVADERSAARLKPLGARHQSDLSRLFERLKQRLEKLPTRMQRKNVLPEKPAGKRDKSAGQKSGHKTKP